MLVNVVETVLDAKYTNRWSHELQAPQGGGVYTLTLPSGYKVGIAAFADGSNISCGSIAGFLPDGQTAAVLANSINSSVYLGKCYTSETSGGRLALVIAEYMLPVHYENPQVGAMILWQYLESIDQIFQDQGHLSSIQESPGYSPPKYDNIADGIMIVGHL